MVMVKHLIWSRTPLSVRGPSEFSPDVFKISDVALKQQNINIFNIYIEYEFYSMLK